MAGAIPLLSISYFLIVGCVLLTTNPSFISANEVIITGKLGDKPVIRFTPVEREVRLICDLGEDVSSNSKLTPQWSFKSKTLEVQDVALGCEGRRNATSDNSTVVVNALVADCEVKQDDSKLTLRVFDITENEFGSYVCHNGAMSNNFTVILKELVHLTRKAKVDSKIKVQHSVTVLIGETLPIYCNATGLRPEHKISWRLDGKPVTLDLDNQQGLFQNFTPDGNLSFYGPAQLEHRGNYTCQVDTTDRETKKFYPIEFSFFVRVKVGDEWKLPGFVLLGECALILLFTVIINWRESRLKDEDIVIEDSEDEDDDVPKGSRNSNGVQNNNSNGK